MKYIGNKTRLLEFIYDSMVKSNIPMNGVFCDIFSGTSSVAKFFKEKRFKIISNDFMTYSFIAQFVNVKMNKLPAFIKITDYGIDEVLNILNNMKDMLLIIMLLQVNMVGNILVMLMQKKLMP